MWLLRKTSNPPPPAKKQCRILCISDDVDPLLYSPNIQEHFGDIDIILSAGDLYFNYYNYIVTMLNKPLYFVFGNHNLRYLCNYLRPPHNSIAMTHQEPSAPGTPGGGTYIGNKVVRLKKYNLIVAGLGGCKRYSNGLNQFSELQMLGKIISIIPHMLWNRIIYGRYLDILLTHAAPLGINDRNDCCHKGFKVFLWFMNIFKPKYLLHGHIHLYDINSPRITTYQDTKVINVYSRYELEL